MNEVQLRRWVRGELGPVERRQVSRWIVTCAAPELGPVMFGMVQELRSGQADAALQARGSAWAGLVAAWSSLLDAGRAHLATGVEAQAAVAAAGGEHEGLALRIIAFDDGMRVEVAPVVEAGDLQVLVILTGDDGTLRCLAGPISAGRPVTVDLGASRPPRATVWTVRGAALPTVVDAAGLAALLGRGDVEVRGVREQPV